MTTQFDRYAFAAHLLAVESEQDVDDLLLAAADHIWDSMQVFGRPDAVQGERSTWERINDLTPLLMHTLGNLR